LRFVFRLRGLKRGSFLRPAETQTDSAGRGEGSEENDRTFASAWGAESIQMLSSSFETYREIPELSGTGF
jgi:hypothetical protein